jgi:GAF domain-containing protein
VFTPRVERTVVGLAAQAAVALDNAHLFDEAQREIERRKRAEEENARLLADAQEAAERQRRFLRDVLFSVSEASCACAKPRPTCPRRSIARSARPLRWSAER